MADFVWPEDEGTGASAGDKDDAANFATAYFGIGYTDYVRTGLDIAGNVNFAANEYDVDAGMAVLSVDSLTGTQTGEARDQGNGIVAIADARSNKSLTDSAVNDIYLIVDLSADDTITIDSFTSGPPSTDPHLKIAEVDTANDTVTELNRAYPMDRHLNLGGNHVEADDETPLFHYSNGSVEFFRRIRTAEGDGINVETLSGAKALDETSARRQKLDPGGANRDVNLPDETDNEGLEFEIVNAADGAEDLVVKDDGGTTIATLNQDEKALFVCDGTNWNHTGIETISLS